MPKKTNIKLALAEWVDWLFMNTEFPILLTDFKLIWLLISFKFYGNPKNVTKKKKVNSKKAHCKGEHLTLKEKGFGKVKKKTIKVTTKVQSSAKKYCSITRYPKL